MLIKDYCLPDPYSNLIRVGDTADVFVEDRPADNTEHTPPVLLVWRGAMRDDDIQSAFMRNDWPLRLLHALPSGEGWAWELKLVAKEEPIKEWDELLKLTEAATGAKSAVHGNVTVTLPLRVYDDVASTVGGVEWWVLRWREQTISDQFVAAFFNRLTYMLEMASRAGADLYVEQISIILGKDHTREISTLTPTLHSDTYYGFRETALCSLTEHGCNRFGGTLFVPTLKMDVLEPHRPIFMEKLFRIVGDAPIVEANSGDVLMYDGMIGQDGKTSMQNGVPHISPDLPGTSSRLLILMRNKGVRA